MVAGDYHGVPRGYSGKCPGSVRVYDSDARPYCLKHDSDSLMDGLMSCKAHGIVVDVGFFARPYCLKLEHQDSVMRNPYPLIQDQEDCDRGLLG